MFRGEFDRLTNTGVRAATAQYARHSAIDILVTRIRVLPEQGTCRHDLPGLAITALRYIHFVPGFLDRVLAVRVEALNRRDFHARHADRGYDAGAHGYAIDQHRARAAGADAAAVLRADEVQIVAQRPQKRRVGRDIDRNGLTVDLQAYVAHRRPRNGRLNTKSATAGIVAKQRLFAYRDCLFVVLANVLIKEANAPAG